MTFLSDLKTRFETTFTESTTNFVVIQAYNDFCSMVERAESKRYGHRHRKEVTVSLPSSGYLLTGISDIQNYDVGFHVFVLRDGETMPRSENKLERIPHGIQGRKGYYVSGNTLYSNIFDFYGQVDAVNILIQYMAKTARLVTSADLKVSTFAFDQDLETAFMYYLSMLFYQGKFQPTKVGEAQQWSMGWLNEYFSNSSSS